MRNISWEAQQSQYDLCILEDELNHTQSLLNQKCAEIRNANNNIDLHNEIAKLQEKLLESENNLQAKSNECKDLVHKHQFEIRDYKEQLSKNTSGNGNVEIFKMKKQEKVNKRIIWRLQKKLQDAKEAKLLVEYDNRSLISEINRLKSHFF